MNQKVSVLILHSSVTPQIEILAREMRNEFLQKGYEVHLTKDVSSVSHLKISSFDLVCIGTEEGNRGLEDATKLFSHPQVAAFSSCRRSLLHLRKKADKENARISDLALFPVKQGKLYPLASWLKRHMYGKGNPDFEGFQMFPFGIPDEELGRARTFASNLARQLVIQQESALVYS